MKANDAAGAKATDTANAADANGAPREQNEKPQPTFDAVEEAAMESFPASDPPTFIGAAATPSRG